MTRTSVYSHFVATSTASAALGIFALGKFWPEQSAIALALTSTVLSWLFIATLALVPSLASSAIAQKFAMPKVAFYVLWNCALFAACYVLINQIRFAIGIGVPDEPVGPNTSAGLWPLARFITCGAIYGLTYHLTYE